MPVTENIGTLFNLLTVAGLAVVGWFLKEIYSLYREIERRINEHQTELAVHTEKIARLEIDVGPHT